MRCPFEHGVASFGKHRDHATIHRRTNAIITVGLGASRRVMKCIARGIGPTIETEDATCHRLVMNLRRTQMPINNKTNSQLQKVKQYRGQ